MSEEENKKKSIAEKYIAQKRSNLEINNWYIRYLKKPESMISSRIVDSNFGFSTFESIDLLNELFLFCHKQYDDKNEAIIRMVLTSYSYIFEEIIKLDNNEGKIEKLTNSLWELWEKSQSIAVIEKYSELELKHVTYIAPKLSFSDIEEIVNTLQ